jgi:hypothetical protein
MAVRHERQPTVKLLIERGAPLEATNSSSETPLALAVRALVEQSEWPRSSTQALASNR